MSARDFPFRPPRLEPGAPLRWVLARAFGPSSADLAPDARSAAVGLATRLGLGARILARCPQAALAAELGPATLERLRDERRALAARQLRSEAALADLARTAGALGVPWVLLKGQALILGGWAPPDSRPAGDVDVLVPRRAVARLQAELVRRGFRPTGTGYEHQAPSLLHPHGGLVELHRMLLGIRLGGRRSAGFDELERAGLLERRGPTAGEAARTPAREVLAAHALVHVLAQHAWAPGAYSGLLLAGDLADLGLAREANGGALVRLRPWIRQAVPARLLDAAVELTATLCRGELPGPETDAGRLLAHFVLGVTDEDYALSLKTRLLERPLSDRGRAAARLALLARTLAPPRQRTADGGREEWWRWGLRLTGRPVELARRWRRARRKRPEDRRGGPGPG
jgi:hypothetical protein